MEVVWRLVMELFAVAVVCVVAGALIGGAVIWYVKGAE